MFFGQRALEIFKILEEARRKRGEAKVGLEEIRKVAAEAMGEGDKDQADAEAVVERVSHKKSEVERVDAKCCRMPICDSCTARVF